MTIYFSAKSMTYSHYPGLRTIFIVSPIFRKNYNLTLYYNGELRESIFQASRQTLPH